MNGKHGIERWDDTTLLARRPHPLTGGGDLDQGDSCTLESPASWQPAWPAQTGQQTPVKFNLCKERARSLLGVISVFWGGIASVSRKEKLTGPRMSNKREEIPLSGDFGTRPLIDATVL